MQKSLNTSKWYNNAWAALICFTRLPFWRIYQPPKSSYRAVVEFWPFAGWITGSAMAATLYFGSMVMPHALAVVAAISVRLLLTGAFHEDGLADFFDGFGGGGNDRQRVLDIMKDSRIGTYGVFALIIHTALLGACLWSMPPLLAALTIFAADPFSKMLAGQMVQMLPYARNENEAKTKVAYRKPSVGASILLAFQGLLPAIPLILWGGISDWTFVVFVPCLVMYFTYRKIWSTLRGYTGDCCGAVFLMVELSVYITVSIITHNAG